MQKPNKLELTTDFFGWCFLLFFALATIGLAVVAIKFGVNQKSEVIVDTFGIVTTLIGLFIITIELWEIRLLINFLQAELQGTVILSDGIVALRKRGKETVFKISDLRSIDLYGRVFGSKAWTSDLTYSILRFKTGEVIIIPSFKKNIYEVEKLFIGSGARFSKRDRKFFELIPRVDSQHHIL